MRSEINEEKNPETILRESMIFKKREKKKREIRNIIYEKFRKSKVTKKTSEIQKLLNEIAKKRITDAMEIRDFLRDKSYGGEDNGNAGAVIRTLAAARIINGRITLSDSLATKKLRTSLYYNSLDTKVLSNDWLFCYYVFENKINALKNLNDNKNKPENLAIIEFYEKECKLIRTDVCTDLFLCDGYLQKGYVQDYDPDICALGIPDNVVSIGNMIEGANSGEMLINNVKYNILGDADWIIIYKDGINDLVAKVGKQKTIKSNDVKQFSEKILNIKQKPRYVFCKLPLENFCPAFMIFPKSERCYFRFVLEMEYNKLFDFLEKYLEKYNFLAPVGDLLYWDRIEDFFEFMLIFGLTSKNPKTREFGILAKVEKYFKSKFYIDVYAKNQISLQNIYYDFYNSFTNKINYDKLSSLRERLLKIVDLQNILIKQEKDFENMKKLIKEDFMGFAEMCGKQLDDNVLKLPDSLLFILTELVAGRDMDNVIEGIKRMGKAIYVLSSTPDPRSKDIFPFLLSPANFLGIEVASVKEGDDVVGSVIKDYYRTIRDVKDKLSLTSTFLSGILENLNDIKEKILQNSVIAYLTNNQNLFRGDENTAKRIYDLLRKKIYDSSSIMKNLDNLISSKIAVQEDPNTIILNGKEIEDIVNEEIKKYENKEAIKKADEDIKLAELKKQALDAQNRYQSFMEGLSSSIIPDSPTPSASSVTTQVNPKINVRPTIQPPPQVNAQSNDRPFIPNIPISQTSGSGSNDDLNSIISYPSVISYIPNEAKKIVENDKELSKIMSTGDDSKSSAKIMSGIIFKNKILDRNYQGGEDDLSYKEGLIMSNGLRNKKYMPYGVAEWYLRLLQKSNAIKGNTSSNGVPVTEKNIEQLRLIPIKKLLDMYNIGEADIEKLISETHFPSLDKYLEFQDQIDLSKWPAWNTNVDLYYIYDKITYDKIKTQTEKLNKGQKRKIFGVIDNKTKDKDDETSNLMDLNED
jgi:hypothetical protein